MGNGTKYDGEKTRLELIPTTAAELIGKVLTYGAAKYEADNWTNRESRLRSRLDVHHP